MTFTIPDGWLITLDVWCVVFFLAASLAGYLLYMKRNSLTERKYALQMAFVVLFGLGPTSILGYISTQRVHQNKMADTVASAVATQSAKELSPNQLLILRGYFVVPHRDIGEYEVDAIVAPIEPSGSTITANELRYSIMVGYNLSELPLAVPGEKISVADTGDRPWGKPLYRIVEWIR